MTITRAAILAATVAWAVAECVRWIRPDSWKLARASWTAGAALTAAHAIAALHFNYHWSHAAAIEATRLQTLAVTGIDWGGGLYINYAFVALWLWDAVVWWLRPERYRRRSHRHATILTTIFVFMFVNGAILFAHGFGRAVGIAAVLSVVVAWGATSRASRPPLGGPQGSGCSRTLHRN